MFWIKSRTKFSKSRLWSLTWLNKPATKCATDFFRFPKVRFSSPLRRTFWNDPKAGKEVQELRFLPHPARSHEGKKFFSFFRATLNSLCVSVGKSEILFACLLAQAKFSLRVC
jgi:hypothetical protein